MLEKTRLLNLLVCAVFGLVGGMVSHLLLNARAASAQQTSTIVRAERFELMDKKKNVVAVFGVDPNPSISAPELTFRFATQEAKLNADGLYLYADGVQRVALGMGAFRDESGPAMLRDYQLAIYDNKSKLKHQFK